MEHYGIISPDDKAKLEAILASDEEARVLQAEIKAAVSQSTAKAFMEGIEADKKHALAFAKEEYHTRRMHGKYSRNRWLAAAALMAGILVSLYFLFIPNKNGNVLTLSDKDNSILLQLANGETIVLEDSGQQTVTAGQMQLNNANRVLRFKNEKGATVAGWNTLTVPNRLDYRVELSDGSVVWLNSTSKMRFPFVFNERKREVYIEGEAYFEIAADPQHPFIVHANGSDIQVLGTSFNINAYFPDKLSTSLVEGKVAVVTGNERIELRPGKEAVIRSNSKTQIQNFDPQITLGWKQGVHYFQDASMREIADMIPRWFNEKIIIDDTKAGEATFRIKVYRHQPFKQFINQINSTGIVSLYYKDGRLHCKSI